MAGKHGMILGLAGDRRRARQLGKPVGGRIHQRQLALLGHDERQILVGQQHTVTTSGMAAPIVQLSPEQHTTERQGRDPPRGGGIARKPPTIMRLANSRELQRGLAEAKVVWQ